MHCNTGLALLPIPPRLPHALVFLLILSLLWQTGYPLAMAPQERILLPAMAYTHWRGRPGRVRRPSRSPWSRGLRFLLHSLPRALARSMLLAVLLYINGWALTPLANFLLLLPTLQCLTASLALVAPHLVRSQSYCTWATSLQRLYQLTLVVLLLSTLAHLGQSATAHGLVGPLLVGGWVLRPDEATEVSVTSADNDYTVFLRGTFTLAWEPRDSFERWMLILFLRQFHRADDTRPLLTQAQIAEAFDLRPEQVWRWEHEVRQHGWHVLSDRFRRQLHSALPQPDLSRTILKVWVPAFWLSAWDVRERLIQLGVIADREAITLESLHALAQRAGFNQVRDRLLERFDLQGGHLLAKEHWWLDQLLALNARLFDQLERGERLTPQELVEIEPLRLNPSAKAMDSAPPLAAALRRVLFEPPAEPPATLEPVCCTYCNSDQVAPKSKQPRLKTILDEFGHAHVVQVLRYYCHNSACRFKTFTHFPAGVLPHSHYPVQVRVLAVEVYVALLSTYRRSARMLDVKASTVYGWLVSVSPAALCLAAYLGVVRTSGVIGIDDKWVKVCCPSAVPKHGHRPRAVWRYAYFAVDVYSADLLALELYPEHNAAAVRQFLLELKAKGLQPRVIVSDLDPAYGRMLPLIFPQAVHHECIFHAIQNALNQMTQVYGRHYLEHLPATAPLHEVITQLFQAQTQKTVRQRFAALMELRSSYVARTPESACVFDSLEQHFPKLVNAIESPLIPRTNNATELVIRRFDQHYQSMCGLASFESAQVYLRIFELVYRLTPFMDDNPGAKRGQCPLELAGYDLTALPIAEFFIHLKLPPLSVRAETLSQ